MRIFLCWVLATSMFLSWGCPASSAKINPQVKKGEGPPRVNFLPYPPMVHPVRIGLAAKTPMLRLAVWSPGAVFVDNKAVFALHPQMFYSIMNGSILEFGTNRSYRLPTDRRTQIAAADYRFLLNNRWYRGSLEIINFGPVATAIDVLDLEEYLLGVVPSEMPASWHLEALKAQAVAARSYGWAHMGRGSKWYAREGYELVPDVRDQAYKGLAAEAPSTFMAVQQTRGIILKDSGKVKAGFYRAWVGDSYENLNIRKGIVPGTFLSKITGVPKIVGVSVKQWDPNGNARSIQIMGPKKSREVYGVALAKMLNFPTAGILDVQEQGPNWVFTYRGPGNGARGLSQHGANMLASGGWRFDQILTQYYQDPDGHLRLDYMDKYSTPVLPPTAVISPTASAAPQATASSSSDTPETSSDKPPPSSDANPPSTDADVMTSPGANLGDQ